MEKDWLACTDPAPMLASLRGKVSDRKLRLFAVACCRRIWPLIADARSRAAVATAEGFAEGTLAEPAFEAARWEAVEALPDQPDASPGALAALAAADAACSACWADYEPTEDEALGAAVSAARCCQRAASHSTGESGPEMSAQAALLRCVCGPTPLDPIAPNPAWLTPAVVPLAEAIYADRAFDKMPALADALTEAGCREGRILDHCRWPDPHTRGCWVVDLLLAKE